MSETLKPGRTATRRIDIDRERTISFMGDDCRVYATPKWVDDVERTCRDLLLQHTEPGKDSVGTRVELDHVGATMLEWVEIIITLTAVDGAVAFDSRDVWRSPKKAPFHCGIEKIVQRSRQAAKAV
jgi:predicted thioesterase